MKTFKGFTEGQKFKLLSEKLGYKGRNHNDEMDAFITARPDVAARMGKYADVAQKRLDILGYSEGGLVQSKLLPQTETSENPVVDTLITQPTEEKEVKESPVSREDVQAVTKSVGGNFNDTERFYLEKGYWPQKGKTALIEYEHWLKGEREGDAMEEKIQNPETILKPEVSTADPTQIDPNTGKIKGGVSTVDVKTVDPTTVSKTETVDGVSEVDASTYDPTKSYSQVDEAINNMEAVTADPSAQATVQGQLESLMADFEEGTPPWASGAMREAMAVMQSRGMGASSMAGQAVVQAAMEAALPIAMQDAQTFAQFEMQNLQNEQQTMILGTQMRVSSIMSDVASENAAKQFNATSEMQVQQFNSSMEFQVKSFNSAQINAMKQFNASQVQQSRIFNATETNATRKFNAQMKEQRKQFESQNQVVIAQANAQLRQQTTLANQAAENAANLYYAQTVNSLTMAEIDNYWQSERDLLSMTFTATENEKDRNQQILITKLDAKLQAKIADQEGKGALMGVGLDAGLDFLGGLF